MLKNFTVSRLVKILVFIKLIDYYNGKNPLILAS
jgi:hypothetical protein